jgi:flagellar basal-body rod protein FlgB
MLSKVFDGAVEQLTRGLAFSARRHDVLSRNVANLETPSYKARDVVFDDYLRPMAPSAPGEQTRPLAPVGPSERQPRVVYAGDGSARADGNDVNLDRQMARLSENTLFHNALTQILAGQFAALKQAITGRV